MYLFEGKAEVADAVIDFFAVKHAVSVLVHLYFVVFAAAAAATAVVVVSEAAAVVFEVVSVVLAVVVISVLVVVVLLLAFGEGYLAVEHVILSI